MPFMDELDAAEVRMRSRARKVGERPLEGRYDESFNDTGRLIQYGKAPVWARPANEETRKWREARKKGQL